MDLALEVGVSPRHLSFVETGRARPSPELVLALAHHLDVPLRERNTLLLAAGYAPRFGQASLDDPEMANVREAVQQMLDAHDPYPGVVVDRQWNVLLANTAASALTAGIPDHVLGPPLNVYRVCLHPDGLASRTRNLADWASYLVGQLRRTIVLTGDPALEAMHAEVMGYPGIAEAVAAGRDGTEMWEDPPLLVPLRLSSGDAELSLFTTLTTFGTPRDVTLEEIAIELFFPADDASRAMLQAGAGVATA
jgi:transcriptional regulator with XRE-family HTH domain